MISGGLKLFGLQEVGPLALREIAARSEDTSDFLRALAALKEVSIGVSESAFAEALQVFAKQKRQDHFDFIVKSDMHPDSYEDVELQKKLYASFLASNRSVESEATLTILTMLGENLEGETWNHVLQHHCKRSSWHKVYETAREMLDKRLPFSDDSLDLLHRKCLRPRAPGKRPLAIQPIVPRGIDDLKSMSNVFRSIMRSGQELEPTRWREIIRRYCICGQMRGLENLTLWLAAWYAPKGRSITRPKLADLRQGYKAFIPDKMDLPIAVSSSHPSHPLQQLFDARTQIAIVMAGFKSAAPTRDNESSLSSSERNATHYRLNLTRSWARGVLLLKRLKELGVLVHTPLVRKAVVLELWKLYGPATSKVKRNRLAKEFNNITLAQMVAHLEHVWAGTEYGTLFQLPSHLLASDTASSKEELYVAVFGEHRRISLQSKGKYDIASVATGAPRVIRQWDIDTQYEEEL
ncbi:hypothetical protein M8818_000631 [Zalaria obscura]|uniref:Uncharacterized protein n=1 Tax=Zalaria obscura TaxID=2024903 RepID=A0ACC3SMH3_9PEZI